MTSIPNTVAWRDFFEKFKGSPILWKIRSKGYKNRLKKSQAWSDLLDKYKDIDPDATLQTMKIKIGNIRTCYRREETKQDRCSLSGDLYTPKLWYFQNLEFLREQKKKPTNASSLELDENSRETNDAYDDKIDEPNYFEQDADKFDNLNKDISDTSHKELYEEDEVDLFAKYWACGYRKLSAEQQMFAKKGIEDILFLGQLNKLTLQKVSLSSNMSDRSSTPIHAYEATRSSAGNEKHKRRSESEYRHAKKILLLKQPEYIDC